MAARLTGRQKKALTELDRKYAGRFTAGALLGATFVEDLFREIDIYNTERREVAALNQAFKGTLSLISRLHAQIVQHAKGLKKKSGPAFAILADHVSDLLADIERCSREVQEIFRRRWEITLRPYPGKQDKPIAFDIPEFAPVNNRYYPEPFYPKAVTEGMVRSWELPAPKSELKRTIDLHNYFQKRVAAIFHHEFPELSRITLARMVVLVYICSGLVIIDESSGNIKIESTSINLTVSAVYEKLKRDKRFRPSIETQHAKNSAKN